MVAYTDYVFDARVRREAETLAANGFRVLCIKVQNGDVPERYVLNGVEIRELRIRKYQGKNPAAYMLSYARFVTAASAVCARMLAAGELDVVHAHNLPDFLTFAGLLPRLAGRKVVLDVHDSVPETFATKFSTASAMWKALCLEERVSAGIAHRVICVNHPQRDTLIGRGLPSRKAFVSMNVPDPQIFTPRGYNGALTDGAAFDVVYHGTMASRLGVDLIIRAIALLKTRIPNLRLHLWGRGDDLPAFQRLSSELGADDIVEFRPKGYPLQDLPANLRGMHIGVVGNRSGVATDLMLPVKLMEYVALGIPTIVPRLRTIEYYFSDDMVRYFEPENVESLAKAMCDLYAQPDLRREQATRAVAFLDRWGWHRQGGELVEFYRELVGNTQ
jgi:glycosyltransferase involved in cell wall biosynthesis